MKKNLYLLLIYIISLGCDMTSEVKQITPLVSELATKYHTEIKFELEKKIKLNKKVSLIKLTVKDNNLLKKYPSYKIPASFMAVFLAEKLQSIKIDEIQLDFINGQKVVYNKTYFIKDLKRIINKKSVFKKYKDLFIKKQYDKILENFSKKIPISNSDKTKLIEELKNQDIKYGKPLSISDEGYGFGIFNYNNDKIPYVGIISLVKRDINNTQLIIIINEKDNSIVSLKLFWG